MGDTELHNKLCGRYVSYSKNVNMLCRHCDYPTKVIINPEFQNQTNLLQPRDLNPNIENDIPGYFKMISHYPIKNAFHSLDFGCNIYNIHLATPGECLHMHQLGITKRQIEAFCYLIKGNVKDEHGPTS